MEPVPETMQLAVDLALPPSTSAGKVARDAVGEIAGLPPRLREDVRLLVTELVTNSVRHASLAPFGRIEVRAFVNEEQLRVEVEDSGPGFAARPRPRSAGQTSGWGLYLVERVASRWGAVPSGGSCVWFELDLHEAEPVPP